MMGAFGHGPGLEDELVIKVRQELAQSPSTDMEFPISSMTLSLAKLVGCLTAAVKDDPVLDVGTGCGIHAFLLYRKGFRSVLAIDSNERAVKLACGRGLRLGMTCSQIEREEIAQFAEADGVSGSRISFSAVRLEDLAGLVKSKFQVILFNPPGYFFVRNADLSSPAASGVYTGDAAGALEIQQSPLFQFFQRVVLPLLAPGGEAICTWPGLERRAVELYPSPARRGRPAHPADLLESWFDIKVDAAERDPDKFYAHTAVMNLDYGLGEAFWRNFDRAAQDPKCYSTLVKPSNWKYGGRSTFQYGVLSLRRSASIANQFEVVGIEGGSK